MAHGDKTNTLAARLQRFLRSGPRVEQASFRPQPAMEPEMSQGPRQTRHAFIHVGLPKTGTTSIQKTLAASRDILRRHAIAYPGSEEDHAILIALFHPKGPQHFHLVKRAISDPQSAANRLLTEALQGKGDLILSSEYLHNIGEAGARKFHDRLSQAGFDVRFICYVRHPVDLAVSSAQQSIKMGDRTLADVIADPRYTPIRRTVEPFAKAVGKENVILMDFGAAARGGLLNSLFSAIGRPELMQEITEIRANEGLTMDAALFSDLHARVRKETGKTLFPKPVVFQFKDGKFDLPAESKDIVRGLGQKDVDWVAQEFGFRLTESAHPPRYRANPSLDSVAKVIEAVRRA